MKKFVSILAALAALTSAVSAKTLTVEIFDSKNEKVVIKTRLEVPADGSQVTSKSVTETPTFKPASSTTNENGVKISKSEVVYDWLGTVITASCNDDGVVSVSFVHRKLGVSRPTARNQAGSTPNYLETKYCGVFRTGKVSLPQISSEFGKATFVVSD